MNVRSPFKPFCGTDDADGKGTLWYAADPAVSARCSDEDEAVLFHPDTGGEKALNHTGLFLWQQLSRRPRSVQELALDMAAAYDAVSPEQMEQDVEEFLGNLFREGYIQPIEEPAEFGFPGQQHLPGFDDAPLAVDISITGKCNLRCPYCFYHNEMVSQPDLPAEPWLLFFDELGRLSVREVCLSGGEVFVRPDMWELVDGLIENRMRYSLNTNGTRITERVMSAFQNGKRRTRLNSIQVSIDGSCAEINDKSRGEGAFEKTLGALRLLKEAGFPVTARVTVNRHNVLDLENVAKLLLEDVGISSFGTNDAMPAGAGLDNRSAVGLTFEQEIEAMNTLQRLEKKYPGRITAMAGSLARHHLFRAMESARAGDSSSFSSSMGCLTACNGVFRKLAVTHGGVIVPCIMLSKIELGRIKHNSIQEIWTSHPTLQALRSRRQIPLSHVPGCEDCEWNQFCNGGCPGLAYEAFGDIMRPDPYDCYPRFLESVRRAGKERYPHD